MAKSDDKNNTTMERENYIAGSLRIEGATRVQRELIGRILTDARMLERVRNAEHLALPDGMNPTKADIRKAEGDEGRCIGKIRVKKGGAEEEQELELFSLVEFVEGKKEVIFTRRGRLLLSRSEFLEDMRRAV